MKCPKCKAENSAGSKFCSSCGSKMPIGLYCANCGADNLPEDSTFCPDCGAPIVRKESLRKEASSIASSYKKGYDYYVCNGMLPQFSSRLSIEAYKKIISLKESIINKNKELIDEEKERVRRRRREEQRRKCEEERRKREEEQRKREEEQRKREEERRYSEYKGIQNIFQGRNIGSEEDDKDGGNIFVGLIFAGVAWFSWTLLGVIVTGQTDIDPDKWQKAGYVIVAVAFYFTYKKSG